MEDSPSSLVAAALQAKPSTRLGGSGAGAAGDTNLIETYLGRLDISAGELKGEIFDMIKEKYQEFLPMFHDTSEMSAKVQRLSRDMDSLSDRVQVSCKPALQAASQHQGKLKTRLEECNSHISLLSELLAIFDEFEGAQKDYECSNYLSAAKRLKQASGHLQVTLSGGCELQIYLSLKDELDRQRCDLLGLLRNAWEQAFKLSLSKTANRTTASSTMNLELNSRLIVHTGRDITMATLLQCLELLGVLEREVLELGQNLLKYFLVPTISSRVKVSVTTLSRSFMITLADDAASTETEAHQRPVAVYRSTLELFDVISRFLSSAGDDLSLMMKNKLGPAIWQKVCEAIINKCLAPAVPSNAEQLQLFSNVITATQDFERSMFDKGFVPDAQASTLSKYTSNVNIHFASKKCEDLLVRARSLMVSDLHNTILIAPHSSTGLKTPSDSTCSPSADSLSFDEKRSEAELSLAEGVLYMPRCRVSTFVQDLVQLARDTLQEATRSSVESAIQLFFSVRNVFELYPLVTPTFHRRAVSDIPLLAAVQHNNSFYLAHQLLTLGHQFRSQLPAKSWLSEAAAFVDLVPSIRRVGEECLVSQLLKQQNDLLASLEGAHQFTNATDKKRCADIRRALRQVMHQLGQLSSVWRDVLPKTVFLRSIALLIDAVINSVVSSVVALQDISATEAIAVHTELSSLLTGLPAHLAMPPPQPQCQSDSSSSTTAAADKATPTARKGSSASSSTAASSAGGGGAMAAASQDLVPLTDGELRELVPHWEKFRYLLILLDGNLQLFVDLWSQGTGPISSIYTAAEVRQLIRALFQNTERRSNALTTIRLPGT
eukprot:scpid31948/ scgid6827/ Centromere/kinetochore protein zw10 homolog